MVIGFSGQSRKSFMMVVAIASLLRRSIFVSLSARITDFLRYESAPETHVTLIRRQGKQNFF